jgi:hypothetical protein
MAFGTQTQKQDQAYKAALEASEAAAAPKSWLEERHEIEVDFVRNARSKTSKELAGFVRDFGMVSLGMQDLAGGVPFSETANLKAVLNAILYKQDRMARVVQDLVQLNFAQANQIEKMKELWMKRDETGYHDFDSASS